MATKHYSSSQGMLKDLGYQQNPANNGFIRNHKGQDQIIPNDWLIGRTPDSFRGWLSIRHPELLEPHVQESVTTQSVPPQSFPDFIVFMGTTD